MNNMPDHSSSLSQMYENNASHSTVHRHEFVNNNDPQYQAFVSTGYPMLPNNVLSVGPSNTAAFDTSYEENYKKHIVARSPTATTFSKENDSQATFPQRLIQILAEEQSADIISWLPHGNSFIVYDKKRFVETILPRFFKESKFTSFTRKLNRWDFTRISRGAETGAYHHLFFRRDDAKLCLKMKCQKKYEKKLSAAQSKKDVDGETKERNNSSPPPLTPQVSTSSAPPVTNDNVPPLQNDNKSKSKNRHLMQLQQQQREIEQRLQAAVQNASQQPKAQDLFPHLFSQAPRNECSAQQRQPQSQHSTGIISESGVAGTLPLLPQFNVSAEATGQSIGAVVESHPQPRMPMPYLPPAGIYGNQTKTSGLPMLPSNVPYGQAFQKTNSNAAVRRASLPVNMYNQQVINDLSSQGHVSNGTEPILRTNDDFYLGLNQQQQHSNDTNKINQYYFPVGNEPNLNNGLPRQNHLIPYVDYSLSDDADYETSHSGSL